MGIGADRITILEIRSGSVQVIFEIKASEDT